MKIVRRQEVRVDLKAIVLRLMDLGWTRARLADEAGINRTQLSKYMSGSRPVGPRHLRAIADALGLKVDALSEKEVE